MLLLNTTSYGSSLWCRQFWVRTQAVLIDDTEKCVRRLRQGGVVRCAWTVPHVFQHQHVITTVMLCQDMGVLLGFVVG